jgi:aspartate racemase
MKTIGLIGGTTWVSTIEYYRIINQTINEKLGGVHSAHCILYSVDFEDSIINFGKNWDQITKSFIEIAQKLEYSGANFILICANTLHTMYDEIQNNIEIPILHIVDVTAEKIVEKGLKKVGLLGTKYTMQGEFYRKRLKEKFNIETIIPEPEEKIFIHSVIIDELTHEIIKQSSKEEYIKIIKNLISNGAEGIILGCTEIPLLIKEKDVDTHIFDTTKIHALAAVEFALK